MSLQEMKCQSCGSSELESIGQLQWRCTFCSTVLSHRVSQVPVEKNGDHEKITSSSELEAALRNPSGKKLSVGDQLTDSLSSLSDSDALALFVTGTARTRHLVLKHTSHSSVLSESVKEASNEERKVIASNQHCSTETLKELSKEESLKALVGSHPNTDPESLEALARGGSFEAIRNPNISVEVLEKAATSAKISTRRAVASNPATPRRILEKMCADLDLQVKLLVASNPNAQESTFDLLSKDKKIREHYYGDFATTKDPAQRPVWLTKRMGDKSPRQKMTSLLIRGGLIAAPVLGLLLWHKGSTGGFLSSMLVGAFLSAATCIGCWLYTASESD